MCAIFNILQRACELALSNIWYEEQDEGNNILYHRIQLYLCHLCPSHMEPCKTRGRDPRIGLLHETENRNQAKPERPMIPREKPVQNNKNWVVNNIMQGSVKKSA